MQRCRTACGAGCARSMLGHITLLICIGWILNFPGDTDAAPVIERENAGSNNRIPHHPAVPQASNTNQDDSHPATGDERVTTLTENILDNNRDKFETEFEDNNKDGALPVILFPENLRSALHLKDSNLSRNASYDDDDDGSQDPASVDEQIHKGITLGAIEYQPNLVIRCAAKSDPKPNVTWEYDDGPLPKYVTTNSLTFGHGHMHSSGVDDGLEMDSSGEFPDDESWVDLRLPKLNNAFYGKLRCRAENKYGNVTWEVEMVHNANSSMLMKVVRCTLATIFLLIAIIMIKVILWVDRKRRDKLYEKLPPQDLEIINKFKKGLEPPPPSPCSSIIVPDNTTLLLGGAASCIKGIEITVSGEGGETVTTASSSALKKGYRPVKHGSSTPDFQKRLINGGTSTPSTCSSSLVLNTVNTWTNYVPYDDKMETSSQHFSVDFSKIIENGSYGMVYIGKVRNDLTMDWSSVAVKCGKMENNDDSHLLESVLTELKILASLPKLHDNIVNLKGAYTKMLHKRQAYVFVDYCELGTLATFIDLNRGNFRDIFASAIADAPTVPQDAAGTPQNGPNIDNKPITFTAKSGVSINSSENQQDDKATPAQQHIISDRELYVWAWQVAEGMNFLHKNRVVHGNLSSANIYLTGQLKVKIGNIGCSSSEDIMQSSEETSKKWLSVPQYYCEPFSKRSDVWDYGRVIWEIFSLREQECPHNDKIVSFMQNNDIGGDTSFEADLEDFEFEIPQYATPEIFELMLCCWHENATLCPEFDFFVKSFKKLYKEVVIPACRKDNGKSRQN